MSLIFDRKIYRNTPGRFRTRVITQHVTPSLYVDYKHTTIKQYHKEGRALRTETTINDTYDFAIGRRLTNVGPADDPDQFACGEHGHSMDPPLDQEPAYVVHIGGLGDRDHGRGHHLACSVAGRPGQQVVLTHQPDNGPSLSMTGQH